MRVRGADALNARLDAARQALRVGTCPTAVDDCEHRRGRSAQCPGTLIAMRGWMTAARSERRDVEHRDRGDAADRPVLDAQNRPPYTQFANGRRHSPNGNKSVTLNVNNCFLIGTPCL
jgi:hypothetical protein